MTEAEKAAWACAFERRFAETHTDGRGAILMDREENLRLQCAAYATAVVLGMRGVAEQLHGVEQAEEIVGGKLTTVRYSQSFTTAMRTMASAVVTT